MTNTNQSSIDWYFLPFEQLTVYQLHAMYKLRQEVFVVEQNCPYLDTDDKDLSSIHCLGVDSNKGLVAYCRLLPEGVSYDEASIGRVVVAPSARSGGLGKILMKQALAYYNSHWASHGLRISAQCYLEVFYQSLGFITQSQPYDEDGIPHIEMLLSAE